MDTIHSWLGELYDQVCKQTLTAGVPACQNFGQQEKEIIQHLKEMWDNKQYDVYCLPASVDNPDNLFTTDEPYASGTMALYHQETEEMDYQDEVDPEEVSMLQQDSGAYSESEDDGTTTVQESTEAEIWEAMASVMILSDQCTIINLPSLKCGGGMFITVKNARVGPFSMLNTSLKTYSTCYKQTLTPSPLIC